MVVSVFWINIHITLSTPANMGELKKIKRDLTGQPVPYHSASEQACKRCVEINDAVKQHGAPPLKEQALEDGDEIIFRVSRHDPVQEEGEESEYFVSPNVIHYEHDGEFGEDYQFDRGMRDKHNAVIHAVVERTGYDFGKQNVEKFDLEYEPDFEEDALTLSQVDVLGYSSPLWGNESSGGSEKMPEPIVPLDIPGFWPDELQKSVYEYIQTHQ